MRWRPSTNPAVSKTLPASLHRAWLFGGKSSGAISLIDGCGSAAKALVGCGELVCCFIMVTRAEGRMPAGASASPM